MAVFRVEKNKNYTTMSNFHLRDKELSLKAKGLLSQMLSLPEDWNYSISGLAAINKESRDSIRTAICELESRGYILRQRLRTDSGTLSGMEYVVYEKPVQEKPMLENPTQDEPSQGKPALEIPAQLSTNVQNKDLSITDDTKEAPAYTSAQSVKRTYGTYQNVRLADEEVEKLAISFPNDYKARIERLSEYMESSGKSYRNHYLTICQWAKQDALKEKKITGCQKFENYECQEGESY